MLLTKVVILSIILTGCVRSRLSRTPPRYPRTFKVGSNQPRSVNTTNGLAYIGLECGTVIVGTEKRTKEQNATFFAFRGMRFAQPPVGNLRFRAPVPLSPTNPGTVIDATKDGNMCLQQGSPTEIIGSEDCLFINVYTPKLPYPNTAPLSVMVWFFGGYFLQGGSTYSRFPPDFFMDDGRVIVVTFNYRVGIFGFLSTQDYASPGNYGIKDQILALKWVKQNIASFGGDPGNVTIFGESAGSISVSFVLQTPLSRGLYRNAIMESGTSLSLFGLARNPNVAAQATAIQLGINATDSKTLIEELRKVDCKTLLRSSTITDINYIIFGNLLDGFLFAPAIEPIHPGAVIVGYSHAKLNAGLFEHVPTIIGFNSLEALPFVEGIDMFARFYYLKYDISSTGIVPASMNIRSESTAAMVNWNIRHHYVGLDPFLSLPSSIPLNQLISDDQWVRPVYETVRLMSKYSRVYFYEFSYVGYLGSGNTDINGVGHGDELPYLWAGQNNRTARQEDKLTIRRMITMWINFATRNDPTPSEDPMLENVIWPSARSTRNEELTHLNIGRNLTVKSGPFKNTKYWYDLFKAYGNPPYSTY